MVPPLVGTKYCPALYDEALVARPAQREVFLAGAGEYAYSMQKAQQKGSWPSSREPGQDEHDQDTHRPGDVRAYNKVFGNSLFAEDGGRAGGGGSPARRMAWTAQEGGNDSDTDQGAPRARSPPHGNEGRAAVPAQPAPRARTPPSGSYVVTQGPHATGAEVLAWEGNLKHMLASHNRFEAVHVPGPRAGLVKCFIKREKERAGLMGKQWRYQLFLENGQQFLLASRLRKNTKNPNFLMTCDPEDDKCRCRPDECLAKVKADFMGRKYTLWSHAMGNSHEALCLHHRSTDKTEPRNVCVAVPAPGAPWGAGEGLGACLSRACHRKEQQDPAPGGRMLTLCSKPPVWSEAQNAYTLKYNGRAKQASVKNLQLVAWDPASGARGEALALLLGKQSSNTYALDFGYPFNLESAFAVALATLDAKLCYSL